MSARLFQLRWLYPGNWNLRLIWDLIMVWAALVNLTLIAFDMTYLILRPYYVRYAPLVIRVYDPVLGIEPDPLTVALLGQADQVGQLLALDSAAPGLGHRVRGLRELTLRVIEEDPFQRSGQSRTMEVLRLLIASETAGARQPLGDDERLAAAVDAFWPDEPALLARRLELFDEHVRPLLEINYYREVTLDGRPVDHFWLLDLPFLCLFLVEFGVRWSLAVRRRTYARWFFFPIFNWYDLIGLVPYTQFRVFRLLRVVSIYMRLRRSEMSRVGKDVFSRAVAYASNIIAEEISDVVSLRILNETQAEIRDGTHRRIFDATIVPRRGQIEAVLVRQIREVVADEATQEHIRELLRVNLDKAATESASLRAMPLPASVLRPLVRGVGQVVLETVLETLIATLESEEGERAARALIGGILDQVLAGPWRDELDALGQQISLEVIDHMKEAVAVKKWAEESRKNDAGPPGGGPDDRPPDRADDDADR